MLTIIDYGIGNLNSIKNMLKKVGYNDVVISDNLDTISKSDKYILPGVGHFKYGMNRLKESGIIPKLKNQVFNNKKPILGICLGAQLLTKHSEEGNSEGLGWLDARTVKFDASRFNDNEKVPHMGWTDIDISINSALFTGMYSEPRFYFVHSYHMQAKDPNIKCVTAKYGYEFDAGLQDKNIMAMQFHPEKSHKFGMKLFENFINNF